MADRLTPLHQAFQRRGVPLQAIEGAVVPSAFSDPSEEHLATRRRAGLFDFAFMMQLDIGGTGARAFLERIQTRALADLPPGRIRYTLLLREDGSVFVDATVWCLAPDRYWLVTGRRSDFAFVAGTEQGEPFTMHDRSSTHAVIALQGPEAPRILERWTRSDLVRRLPYFSFAAADVSGVAVTIARLGYSGEIGYEIIAPIDGAPMLWGELIGHPFGVRECGLQAADSLRIESGYILFSNELTPAPDPFELGLARLVMLDGRRFAGCEALQERRWREPRRRLVGLVPLAARPCAVPADLPRALVTSRAFSPILGHDLALGFVPSEAAQAGELVGMSDSDRGRVARLPFYDLPRALPRTAP